MFACLDCGGKLVPSGNLLRCVGCTVEYAVRLGVPILANGCKVVANTETIPDQTLTAVGNAYGIPEDEHSKRFFEDVLSYRYHFADSALDSENNLLLQRLGIEDPPDRCATKESSIDSEPHWRMVRHYIPSELHTGLETSFNVRLRNTGECAWVSNWMEGRGYELVPRWAGSTETEAPSPVPISLPPGEEVTVPVYFTTPARRGRHILQLALRSPADKASFIDPIEIPIVIHRPANAISAYLRRKWSARQPLQPVYGPAIGGYDEDHHVAIRLVHEEAGRRASQNGLEIGGCSTPMTVNLPCQIVSTDIDVQTLQVGRYVLAHRKQTNVTFVCCDSHALPFQPKSFDFVAIFSALHHFSDPASVLKKAATLMRSRAFMAVMCDPVGHYRGQPDEECMGQMALGVNEQRFSLAEYDRMFHDAGLEAVSAQVDHDSLKCILQLRKQ